MAILKRALLVLAILLALPLVLVLGLFLYAKTDSGLATIAGLVETYGSSPDQAIRIGRLEGSFPSDLTLRDLELSDTQGRWLAIDRARFAWSPLDVLSRRVTVEALELGRVEVARAPLLSPSTEPEPPADPDAPLIPDLPVEIEVKRFALDDLVLGEPVIGVPARLAAEAAASLRQPSEGLSANFDLRRTDGVAGRVKASAQYVPSTDRIQISVRGGEPAGGLIARLAQIPGLPPIDIGIEGGGTLDALRAQAALTAGDRGRVDAAIDVAAEGAARSIKLSVDGDVERLAPPAFAELVRGQTRLGVEAVVPDAGAIRLTSVTADSAAGRLTLAGTVDPDAKTLDVTYAVTAGDVARFATLLPPGLGWSALSVEGTAVGPFTHPAIAATLTGSGIDVPQAGAESVRVVFDAKPDGPLTEHGSKIAMKADVAGEGVRLVEGRFLSGAGRPLRLNLDAVANVAGETDIRTARLSFAGATATYAGSVSPDAAKGRTTLAADDLSAFSALAGRTLAGTVNLEGDIDVAFDLSRLNAAVTGRGARLATGIQQVDGLTGGALDLSGGVRRAADGSFAFDKVEVKGGNVVVTADGSATAQNADVRMRAEISDISKIDARAAGSATLSATLAGRLDDLVLRALVEAPQARAMERELKGVRIEVDATDVTGDAAGRIALAGTLDGKPLQGTGRLVSEPSGARRIEALDLAIASATVKGAVTVDPAGLATGRLTVDAPDLAEIGALALTELAGSFSGDVGLSAPGGVQRATVVAKGADVAVPGARIRRLDMEATVVDPTGRIVLDGAATAEGVAAAGQALDRIAVKAVGAPEGMDVSADLVGLGTAVGAAGRIAYGPTETAIDLTRLNVKGGGQTAALVGPARVRLVGSQVAIDRFALRADQGGTLDVAGEAGETLDLTVAIRDLPLALGNAFAPNLGLAGVLKADAKVTGPASTPTATFTVDGRDLSLAELRAAKVPALQVASTGLYEGGRVTTDTTITGLERLRVTAQGSAPVGAGDLDLTVAIRDLPLSIANGFVPELGLAGLLNGDAKIVGPVAASRGTYAATVQDFTSAKVKGVPAVTIESRGALEGLRVTTDTTISGGGGIRATARGSAPLGAGDLDLDVAIAELPLSLANAVMPSLGLGGILKGGAKVTGPTNAPRGGYDLQIAGFTAAQAKGAPPLDIAAKGELEGRRVTTDTTIAGPDGLRVTAQGSAPLGDGDLDMRVSIRSLPLSLANAVSPELGLAGRVDGDATFAGPVSEPRGTYAATVRDFTSAKARGVAAVTIETKGALEGRRVTTDTAITGGGGVRATVKGSAPIGDGDLDMDVAIASLPLSLANAVMPSLGLGGALQGGAKVTGPLTAPRGGYDFKITGLTAAQAKGVPPLQVTTKGELEGKRVTTDTLATGAGGMRLSVKGAAPIGAGDLDLTAELRSVPVALANGFSPGLGAQGTLQGDARVTGTITEPRGTYNLKVSSLSTAQTRGAGVPAAQIDARGELQGQRVNTNTTVTGAGGLRVTATGSAPLGQGDLNLKVEGRAPLAFLNDTLSVSGDRVDGVATFDVNVGGSTAKPAINGTAQLQNASYSNRAAGLQLRGIQASIAANGTNVDVRSVRATTRNGGSISGSGRVRVDPAAGFPGEISLRAQNAEVLGTDIVTAVVDTDLRLQGPLARRPTVAGTISARSVEIQIPDRLPAQYTPLQGVRHRGAPAQIQRQLNAVKTGKGGRKAEEGFVATLDIDVQANNRIFIRGMGMTAEAGGQIKLAGTSANPEPVGAFELRSGRGQIVVIGQRLTFTRGSVAFAGDLDPTIDFLAETKAKDVTAQVVVTGTASRPQINFTSQPALPTDEVLARLLFKKSAGELNASEALQLAQGLAQYTSGGGGSGALESVRKSLGVDVLDVTAGDGQGGGPAVGVGRYISDNIYLGVRQGTTPDSSRVTVDIDITKNVKVQGEAGATGNSAAGVAVEWDY